LVPDYHHNPLHHVCVLSSWARSWPFKAAGPDVPQAAVTDNDYAAGAGRPASSTTAARGRISPQPPSRPVSRARAEQTVDPEHGQPGYGWAAAGQSDETGRPHRWRCVFAHYRLLTSALTSAVIKPVSHLVSHFFILLHRAGDRRLGTSADGLIAVFCSAVDRD
jgi:hypothetical protein